MTPGARVAAAIEILDRIQAGDAAERALTNWARASRFAGSKDRAAVRDHVFDALRRWRSTAAMGGADSGRGRMIGLLRQQGVALDTLFDGQGHAPAPLTATEETAGDAPSAAAAMDMPDWIAEQLRASWPQEADEIAETLRNRAPVFLRVNLLRATRAEAIDALARDEIDAEISPACDTALRVTRNPRRIAQSAAFASGLVELQDASSQAVIACLDLQPGQSVLDFCAGGGGKALGIAARTHAPVHVHDADPRRMSDIPARAGRAGVQLPRYTGGKPESFDLVLCDVPCSGSGSWRRAPEGKWRLSRDEFKSLLKVQQKILHQCADLVAPQGQLAFVTCSVLRPENQDQVADFLSKHPDWQVLETQSFLPGNNGDGMFICIFGRVGFIDNN